MYGNNCICVYSPKIRARWGVMMCMTAAISQIITVASVTALERPGAGMPGRQAILSDLFPCSLPRSDKDGGSRGFSCLKKAFISASGRACKDKNNLVSRAAFALAEPSLSAPFFRPAGGLFENVYRLGFFITSDKGLEAFSILSVTNSVTLFYGDGWSILETINDRGVHDLASVQSD